MAKKVATTATATSVSAAATAAGLDWQTILSFLSNLNWLELFSVIRQLIDILKGKSPVIFAAAPGGGCSQEQLDHAKAHFDAITELSECGSHCCDHP